MENRPRNQSPSENLSSQPLSWLKNYGGSLYPYPLGRNFLSETDPQIDQSLGACMSRINLSSAPHRQSPILSADLLCDFSIVDSVVKYSIGGDEGSLPLSFQANDKLNLQRVRVENAVNGQMGFDGAHRNLTVETGQELGSESWEPLWVGSYPTATDNGANYYSGFHQKHDESFLQRKKQLGKQLNSPFPIGPCSNRRSSFSIDSDQHFDQLTDVYASYDSSVSKPNSLPRRLHQFPQNWTHLPLQDLRGQIVSLAMDQNGCRLLQHCLISFSNEDNKYLLNEIAENCVEIATNKSGCRLLQSCVEHSRGKYRERLVAEIIANALHLAEDPYGNYVVQHLLGLKIPVFTENLLRQLEGNYVSLSCNKYASNVMEKCLIESGEEQSSRIIMELLRSRKVSMLLVDPFGNFVIQSALSLSKGFIRKDLINLVRANAPSMRTNLYGKKVLACFDKLKLQHV